jgi:phosphoribosyl 1,2-cyclic phosphodiesterase
MPQIRYNFKNISKLLKPIETKVITNEHINHINDLLDVIIESKEQCKK